MMSASPSVWRHRTGDGGWLTSAAGGQVNLVVNFDIPVNYNRATEPEYETYLHRIGRSGRFGRKGEGEHPNLGQVAVSGSLRVCHRIRMRVSTPRWQMGGSLFY